MQETYLLPKFAYNPQTGDLNILSPVRATRDPRSTLYVNVSCNCKHNNEKFKSDHRKSFQRWKSRKTFATTTGGPCNSLIRIFL
jgi:hypothetical protein